MNFDILLKFLPPILLIGTGLMAKYSVNDGWTPIKKYWVFFVVLGAIILVLNVVKYLIYV